MIEIVVTARKWGNSLGFTIPLKVVQSEHIIENQKFEVAIKPVASSKVMDFFGLAKGWTLDAQKAKDFGREEDDLHDKRLSGLLRSH